MIYFIAVIYCKEINCYTREDWKCCGKYSGNNVLIYNTETEKYSCVNSIKDIRFISTNLLLKLAGKEKNEYLRSLFKKILKRSLPANENSSD